MKQYGKESGLSKRRRFVVGFLCVLTGVVAFGTGLDVVADSDSELVRRNDSTELGQRRLSDLFFFSRPTLPRQFSPKLPHSSGPSHLRTWLRGFGNWTSLSGGDSRESFDAKSYGVSLGIDRQLGRNILIGAGLGGSWCSVDQKQGDVSKDVSAFHGSLYTRFMLQRFYFDFEGGIGSDDNKESDSTSTATQGNLNGEVGTWWEAGLAKVEPYIGIRQIWYDDKSPRDGNKTTSVFGVRYTWKTVSALAVTTPRIYGGWLHEWSDKDLFNVGSFVDAPTVYRFNDANLPADRFFVGGGFTSSMGSSLDVYLRYTAEIASRYSAHTLILGMNWNY